MIDNKKMKLTRIVVVAIFAIGMTATLGCGKSKKEEKKQEEVVTDLNIDTSEGESIDPDSDSSQK